MNTAELKASCARMNIEVHPCIDPDSNECNFAFAVGPSVLPPCTFQQRDKHSCSFILQSNSEITKQNKHVASVPTKKCKPCTIVVLLVALAVIVGLISFYITINQE